MAAYRINYSKVCSQAENILTLSYELNSEIQKLESVLAEVKREWVGPASKEYQNQLYMLIADMKNTKHKMSSVSSTIKNVAARIQREDERAAEKEDK